ncbi:class I SAM-dependent methyltransferase [Candidatus Laterigemmans baculatus]|uniref:class I SAM-dependent methyltransferase n=1 Tax=Candidatus Laterigemmans baculatus TaxID=2770505 RepID=UPI001F2C8A22|nr:class I SAM-dependent methyltransferase [Candidatus Laterigemmans baculatus]
MTHLTPIDIPAWVMDQPLPGEVRLWVNAARERIQAFQDRWDRPQIEQFVASDYELVYQTLAWIEQSQLAPGRRFLEWGCGFAVVCCLAAKLDFDVFGIEAEAVLIEEGRRTVTELQQPVELFEGNFLPPDSEWLADDPTLPSLGHPVPSAYGEIGMEIDDFAIVFAYPWPGEEDFLADVFARYAAPGALLLQFCGPYDLRLWRKGGRGALA